MADVKFLRVLEAGLASALAEVQRQLGDESGNNGEPSRRPRARRVIVPTETDTAAARKAQVEIRRAGMLTGKR